MEIESREKEKRTLSYYDENAAAFCEGTRNADMSEMRETFPAVFEARSSDFRCRLRQRTRQQGFYGKWI